MRYRPATFNGNQFNSVAKWRADLLERMPHCDRIFLQESVHFDCEAFVNDPAVIALVGEWGYVQTRDGDNDGKANTAILYRIAKGVPSQTALIDLGKADGAGPDEKTRERYLCAGQFPEGWQGSFHGFPTRDAAANPELIRRVGEWAKANNADLLATDKNQIPAAKLERATGLKWRGVGIDGFLTNRHMGKPEAFSRGFSDHPGVRAVVSDPTVDKFARAIAYLRAWLASPKAATATHRARKARKAIRVLTDKQTPQPVPAPPKGDVQTWQRVAAAVRSQVGYHEEKNAAGHWDNVEKFAALVPGLAWVSTQQGAWCDVFACWGLLTGGLRPDIDFPVSASCNTSAAWYKFRQRFSEYPALGAQILYQLHAPGDFDHTGIVVGYTATTVTTVEGNTNDNGSPEGDGVYLKTHDRTATYINGYGYPVYPEGVVSADPAWKGKK